MLAKFTLRVLIIIIMAASYTSAGKANTLELKPSIKQMDYFCDQVSLLALSVEPDNLNENQKSTQKRLTEGNCDFPANKKDVFKWLRSLSRSGNHNASYLMAKHCLNGGFSDEISLFACIGNLSDGTLKKHRDSVVLAAQLMISGCLVQRNPFGAYVNMKRVLWNGGGIPENLLQNAASLLSNEEINRAEKQAIFDNDFGEIIIPYYDLMDSRERMQLCDN